MSTIEDTYFSSFNEAYEEAKKQNIFGSYDSLQICYYSGEKRNAELNNLIHLDENHFEQQLIELGTRPPTLIKAPNKSKIQSKIEHYKALKQEACNTIIKSIKSQTLCFKPPYRVYLSADYGGKVVLEIYHHLAKAFQSIGCEVLLDVNTNTTLMDDYKRLNSVNKFNPHLVFNINRIRNNIISNNSFCFTWFMDPTLVLYDDSEINFRERDIYFYLVENFKKALIDKHCPEEILHKQSFATNPAFMGEGETDTEKDDKIVFIGNDYFSVVSPTIEYHDSIDMLSELASLFNNNILTEEKMHELSDYYHSKGIIRSPEHLEMFIFPALVRIEILKWVIAQSSCKVEIYGKGWDRYDEFKPYYKGILNGTLAVKEICKKAKYSLLAHPEYFYQQRLMEASATGSIPLVYKGINNKEEFEHYDNALVFYDKQSLLDKIGKNPTKSPEIIAKDLSYKAIANKAIAIMLDKIS